MFNRNIIRLLMLLVAVSAAQMSFAQSDQNQPRIEATVSPDTILIGDRFNLDVTIEKDLAQVVEFPDFENGRMNEVMEIVDVSAIDTLVKDGRRLTLKRRYTLTTFDEGIYNIERFPMLYADKNIVDTIFSVDSMKLIVRTFEIDTLKQQIVDIKKPLDTPLVFAEVKDILLWSLLALAIIAVAYYYIRKYLRAKRAKEDSRPDEPFYITALRMMEQLKNDNLCVSGKYKQHYTTLTDILREYLEYRWDIAAMEMTSDEILTASIKKGLTKEDIDKLKEVFEVADLVKFAKMTPSEHDNISSFNAAYRFIDQTKPMPLEEQPQVEESVKS